jgi:tRNA(Ile)-lysidine synthase
MQSVRDVVAASLPAVPGRVFVGFSGGLDSSVLLHAVAACRDDGVVAVHVHHGLHPDADRWQAHCARVCDAWQLPLRVTAVTVPRRGSVEAHARAARYRVFERMLDRPGDLLLLAHHLDDQAETGLLRLLQGRGFYGMPASRAIGAGYLARPLLALSRADLEAYAVTHGLSWVDDPGNAELHFDRNYVRHRLLPQLRQRWPGVVRAIVGALPVRDAVRLAAAETLAIADLGGIPREQAITIIREWLSGHGVVTPRRAALVDFLAQIEAPEDRQPRLSLTGAELRRFRGRLHLVRPAPYLTDTYQVVAPGCLRLPHGELHLLPDPNGWHPVGALAVRFRRGGERVRWRGHQRTLKQLLHGSDLPPWRRDTLPLLFDDLGLLAVPGIAHRDGGVGAGFRAEWRWDTAGP